MKSMGPAQYAAAMEQNCRDPLEPLSSLRSLYLLEIHFEGNTLRPQPMGTTSAAV
jgi:hypothetical protein